ncbi:MAG: hypothetical protein KC636_15080 [Myxococcales bacterium]|nr:hypothetical protein [Myxococcales bacterium]
MFATTLPALALCLATVAPPGEGVDEGEASQSYRAPQPAQKEDGKLESILALLSLRLGLGSAFHPRREPGKGLALEGRLGAVFLIPPILAVWPEAGGSFEVRDGFHRAQGTLDLNVGLPAFLYYGVGFAAGAEAGARLLGVRHGLDVRLFQVFGIQVLHHVSHTPLRGLQHEVHLLFSFDVLALVPLSGSKATIWKVGERRVGGRR